jgi:hypothetical protein
VSAGFQKLSDTPHTDSLTDPLSDGPTRPTSTLFVETTRDRQRSDVLSQIHCPYEILFTRKKKSQYFFEIFPKVFQIFNKSALPSGARGG